ncbi:MAG TPA: hypothetical protein VHB21_02275 [Minicystis sp.]|nr:hypothetical protein [Minicystis sp.]
MRGRAALAALLTAGGCAISFRDLPPPSHDATGGAGGGGGTTHSTAGSTLSGGGALDGSGGAGGTGGTSGCTPVRGAVDQASLDFSGGLVFANGMPLSQTFTVGKTGTLTGIELSLASCNHSPETGSSYRLDVLDSGGATLATASLPAAPFGATCPPPALGDTVVGLGYFDVTSACVHVDAGEVLRLVISRVGFADGQCAGLCTAGRKGHGCASDADCDTQSATAYSNTNTYSFGAADVPSEDLDFKTFVE